MFVEHVHRKAERAGGIVVDLHTWSPTLSQCNHPTHVCTKRPLSQRWHVLGDGSGVVQRDIYAAFLARCVMTLPRLSLLARSRWSHRRTRVYKRACHRS